MKKNKMKSAPKQKLSHKQKKFREQAMRLRKVLLLNKFKKTGLGKNPQVAFKKNVKKQLEEIRKRQLGFDPKQLYAVVTR